ncbi:MAG: hotdog fold thioesterase [Acidimicrobiia bacterium]|nr:hotdog fold thioesterase [Acidimicrobiia bacterium]
MPDPTAAELLAEDPFAAHLGVRLVDTDPLTVEMTVAEAHCNFLGTAHGAVIYGIADVALSLVSNTEGKPAFMIDSHLVASARADVGDRLTATTERVTLGNTLGTYRITVTNQDERVVAAFTGTVIRR